MKLTCEVCEAIKFAKGKETPCGECMPQAMEENKEAWMIFQISRNQLIVGGMGGVIDINIMAVKTVMDLYEIENQCECMEKVLQMAHIFIREMQKK